MDSRADPFHSEFDCRSRDDRRRRVVAEFWLRSARRIYAHRVRRELWRVLRDVGIRQALVLAFACAFISYLNTGLNPFRQPSITLRQQPSRFRIQQFRLSFLPIPKLCGRKHLLEIH